MMPLLEWISMRYVTLQSGHAGLCYGITHRWWRMDDLTGKRAMMMEQVRKDAEQRRWASAMHIVGGNIERTFTKSQIWMGYRSVDSAFFYVLRAMCCQQPSIWGVGGSQVMRIVVSSDLHQDASSIGFRSASGSSRPTPTTTTRCWGSLRDPS